MIESNVSRSIIGEPTGVFRNSSGVYWKTSAILGLVAGSPTYTVLYTGAGGAGGGGAGGVMVFG